jgi:hypothetical protein
MMVRHPATRVVFCALALLLVAACSSRRVRGFYHVAHRQRYAITNEELRGLQFYVSKDVLVQAQNPGQSAPQVLILRKGTPGVVVDAGPDWIRVAFQKGGTGVRFLTDTRKREDLYWIGTPVPDRTDLAKINDLDDKILLHGGNRLTVIDGADAVLFVDSEDLEKLMASRPHLSGVHTDSR